MLSIHTVQLYDSISSAHLDGKDESISRQVFHHAEPSISGHDLPVASHLFARSSSRASN
jgi:hypothetical protein